MSRTYVATIADFSQTPSAGPENSEITADSISWGSKSRRQIIAAVILLLCGALSLSVDVQLSQKLFHGHVLNSLNGMLEAMTAFAHPIVILTICGAIFLCDLKRRVYVPRLVTAAIGSGLAANVVKMFIARIRPRDYNFGGTVLETFLGLFPGMSQGTTGQSCPSGHCAAAMGFALALGMLYPRGRWLFAAATIMVALQRLHTGAHFLSDTCWGASVGCIFCLLIFRPELFGMLFDRLESTWRSKTA